MGIEPALPGHKLDTIPRPWSHLVHPESRLHSRAVSRLVELRYESGTLQLVHVHFVGGRDRARRASACTRRRQRERRRGAAASLADTGPQPKVMADHTTLARLDDWRGTNVENQPRECFFFLRKQNLFRTCKKTRKSAVPFARAQLHARRQTLAMRRSAVVVMTLYEYSYGMLIESIHQASREPQ